MMQKGLCGGRVAAPVLAFALATAACSNGGPGPDSADRREACPAQSAFPGRQGAPDFIGLDLPAAQSLATEHGRVLAIACQDGSYTPQTLVRDAGRILVYVVNDKVVAAAKG